MDSIVASPKSMNILQQFSQLLFLQSLATGNVQTSMNLAMFGFPSQIQQFSPSPSHNISPSPQASASTSNSSSKNFPTLSALLSSPQLLKSEISPTSSPPPSQMYNNSDYENIHARKYRVHVNRESSKPLQDWLIQHITDPYPNVYDIQELSRQTGFTFTQIRNWFTNNRRRYELKCGSNPLPWIKKDGPTIYRKIVLPAESGLEEGEILE